MLGNLYDFNPLKDMRPVDQMQELDRFILHRLGKIIEKSITAYEKYEFHTIHHALHNFCVVDLSSFYLDIIKDRLYTSPPNSSARKDSQSVIYLLLDSIVRIMAPILPFTSEEIWKFMPEFEGKKESIHLESLPCADKSWEDNDLAAKWKKILDVRAEVTKALEEARVKKLIGHPLDAEILIYISDANYRYAMDGFGEDLRDIFIVSAALITDEKHENAYLSTEIKGLEIFVNRACGKKCERCWKYDTTTGENEQHPGICSRCMKALEEI